MGARSLSDFARDASCSLGRDDGRRGRPSERDPEREGCGEVFAPVAAASATYLAVALIFSDMNIVLGKTVIWRLVWPRDGLWLGWVSLRGGGRFLGTGVLSSPTSPISFARFSPSGPAAWIEVAWLARCSF